MRTRVWKYSYLLRPNNYPTPQGREKGEEIERKLKSRCEECNDEELKKDIFEENNG
tara:strand:- start:300 stop:467 length:168 start_codon:yes stop_codon:yes gene_type:complete